MCSCWEDCCFQFKKKFLFSFFFVVVGLGDNVEIFGVGLLGVCWCRVHFAFIFYFFVGHNVVGNS